MPGRVIRHAGRLVLRLPIFVTGRGRGPGGDCSGGDPHGGGMPRGPGQLPGKPEWDRVIIGFCDGGRLRLFDKRHLARVRLEPDLDALGLDAGQMGRDEFRARSAVAPRRSRCACWTRRCWPGAVICWPTRRSGRRGCPRRAPAGQLDEQELDGLRRELRWAIRSAIHNGGVHTGQVIRHRQPDAACPRCGRRRTAARPAGGPPGGARRSERRRVRGNARRLTRTRAHVVVGIARRALIADARRPRRR